MMRGNILLFVLYFVGEQQLCEAIKNGPGVAEFTYTALKTHSVESKDRSKCRGKPMRNGKCSIIETYKDVRKDVGCKQGWIYNKKTDTCIPKCPKGCINGTCVAPGVCVCPESYYLEKKHCVKAVCNPPCSNYSKCTAMNTCTCLNNTVNINDTCGPMCPDGYFNDPIECSPICVQCFNGTCIGPGQCTCGQGYTNIDGVCLAVCQNCANGDCVAPGQCVCHTNYTMKNGSCSPICSQDCVNGNCVAPGQCVCHTNYTMKDGSCSPICSRECINGDCVAPGQCVCHTNYTMKDGYCSPICSQHCANGYCAEPNKCVCNEGYILKSQNPFTCLPVCTKGCVNSHCVSPEKCLCFKGFESNTTMPNICHKKCDGPCDNGVCTLEGVCECKKNYTLSNGTCLPIAKDCSNCEDGSCDNEDCPSDQNHYPAEITSTGLAGLQLSWLLSGAIGLLLIVLLIVIIHGTWKKRMALEKKVQEESSGPGNYSVMCSNPNKLLQTHPQEDYYSPPTEETELNYETIPINDENVSEYEIPIRDKY